jgi:hypothetical protein
MLQLRGHHLICLHFFRGNKDKQDFDKNLEAVVTRANDGKTIEVVAEADDICRVCPSLINNQCRAEETVRKLDEMANAYLRLSVGSKVRWQQTEQLVQQAPDEWFLDFCKGCEFASACTISTVRGNL